eukprot:TRINITY_DN107071_c0_g1_i1.p1 TRINITY_DN107071_c0_g1~~TRINITY_DN107071_c0_g1_i1.p1  ORF type:complete len:741 (+),score=146.71 TRINITY_DN107071_c0_g1_i1:43-2223(+)
MAVVYQAAPHPAPAHAAAGSPYASKHPPMIYAPVASTGHTMTSLCQPGSPASPLYYRANMSQQQAYRSCAGLLTHAAYVPQTSPKSSYPSAQSPMRIAVTPQTEGRGLVKTATHVGATAAAAAAVAASVARPVSPTKPKREQNSVFVLGRTFERVKDLGSGSFGVVWEVKEKSASPNELSPGSTSTQDSPNLACKKCTLQGNKKELIEAALLEAEVLQALANNLAKEVAQQNFVPRYVAHSMQCVGSKSEVYLIMSKLEGRPLDQWIYGVDEHKLKVISTQELLDGPMPNGQRSTRKLKSACETAAVLIQQMTPVFVALQKTAFHRDISAHNFLIEETQDEKGNTRVKFSVLDFGLAVRAATWHTEWHGRNIAGDPRYFAPSAWMQLTHGHRYLENNPKPYWKSQYTQRLDHYAFGILILEVFFALWEGPQEFKQEAGQEISEELSKWRQSLEASRQAWRTYWTSCVGLFQKFHAKGAAGIRHYLAGGHLDKLAEQLHTLVRHLQIVGEAPPEGELCKDVAVVLKVAADLICPRSQFRWQDLEKRCTELKHVSAFHRKASTARRRRSSSACSAAETLTSGPSETVRSPDTAPDGDEKPETAEPQNPIEQEAEILSPRGEEEEDEPDYFDVAQKANAANQANEQMAIVAEQPEVEIPEPPFVWKKSGHRRVWTLDSAAGMAPSVEVGIGISSGSGGQKDEKDEERLSPAVSTNPLQALASKVAAAFI